MLQGRGREGGQEGEVDPLVGSSLRWSKGQDRREEDTDNSCKTSC